jgi:hypothetical protein
LWWNKLVDLGGVDFLIDPTISDVIETVFSRTVTPTVDEFQALAIIIISDKRHEVIPPDSSADRATIQPVLKLIQIDMNIAVKVRPYS